MNSWYAFWIFVSSEPEAMQTTVCRGTFQPSCSMISYPMVLERKRRIIVGIVFDPEFTNPQSFGQPISLDQWRASHLQPHRWISCQRQQFPETPHAPGAALDRRRRQRSFDAVVIIDHFQRP